LISENIPIPTQGTLKILASFRAMIAAVEDIYQEKQIKKAFKVAFDELLTGYFPFFEDLKVTAYIGAKRVSGELLYLLANVRNLTIADHFE